MERKFVVGYFVISFGLGVMLSMFIQTSLITLLLIIGLSIGFMFGLVTAIFVSDKP